MYRKVLVALDGLELSETVLTHVQQLALEQNSQVLLLRVIPPLEPRVGASLGLIKRVDEQVVALVRQYLEGMAKKLRNSGIKVLVEVRSGRPAEGILNYAEEEGMNLIVMAVRERSGRRRWLFGSLTDKVVQAATVPILLIRAPWDRPDQPKS